MVVLISNNDQVDFSVSCKENCLGAKHNLSSFNSEEVLRVVHNKALEQNGPAWWVARKTPARYFLHCFFFFFLMIALLCNISINENSNKGKITRIFKTLFFKPTKIIQCMMIENGEEAVTFELLLFVTFKLKKSLVYIENFTTI